MTVRLRYAEYIYVRWLRLKGLIDLIGYIEYVQ